LAFPLWIELNHIVVFNLGMGEITVILLLALIVLGPKKLPELASGLGKIIRDIRKATADVKNEIQLDDAIRKPFEELRDAVTLPPEELKRRDRIKRDLEEAKRKAEADMAILAAAAKPAEEAGTGAADEGNAGEAKLSEAKLSEAKPSDAKPSDAKPGDTSAIPGPAAASPSGGVPVPPPLAAGSGPVPVSPPLPPPGSGPNGHAVPPPFHPPHASGSGPIAAAPAAPAGTVPATRPRPAFRPPVAAAAPVHPPKPVPERTSTTQFLSEADLIPPDRPPPPPVPPPLPGTTGKVPAVPGSTGKSAAAPAAHEDEATVVNGAPVAKKDDAG